MINQYLELNEKTLLLEKSQPIGMAIQAKELEVPPTKPEVSY